MFDNLLIKRLNVDDAKNFNILVIFKLTIFKDPI